MTQTIEFEVKEINEDGDVTNVDGYDTEAETIAEAATRDAVAVVVEKHIVRNPDWEIADHEYVTIATFGDAEALAVWMDLSFHPQRSGVR